MFAHNNIKRSPMKERKDGKHQSSIQSTETFSKLDLTSRDRRIDHQNFSKIIFRKICRFFKNVSFISFTIPRLGFNIKIYTKEDNLRKPFFMLIIEPLLFCSKDKWSETQLFIFFYESQRLSCYCKLCPKKNLWPI